ncbi:DNA mismatch repair endonuclease MutL [Aerococcaceae bacterium DSM 111176]|nr:DNA mismatch repair endonuclease MutL [Aerococcaceae bacterium DSM 111176]
MAKIKQMEDALANQIAAGEVVERPSSVVKELVENAIDAGSTMVTIELLDAGIQQIKVIDNGEGMAPEDLRMATLPHATSKIYNIHDLFNIHSLGFRGEALASIGSVSKLTLESTQNDAESGYAVLVEGSKIVEETKTKARKGTTITVDSLFYNTPARLKHLKTIQTELKHTVTFIQNISLAYPEIRFTLFNDGNRLFYTTGTNQLQQTIANVYSPAIARQLIPIEGESLDFKVTGFISPPQITRTSKQYIHWMINNRPIKSIVLDKILLKAYGRQLMIGRYPLTVINIDLDPRLVDVNVHPTKQTVRLSKEEELGVLLDEIVTAYLREINPIPEVDVADIQTTKKPKEIAESVPFKFDYKPQMTDDEERIPGQFNRDSLQEALGQQQVTSDEEVVPRAETAGSDDFQPQNEVVEEIPESFERTNAVKPTNSKSHVDFHALRYVGQIHGTYLVAESESGFFLIDQHAAQERIRYEQLMDDQPETHHQQQLLIPIILEFSPSEMISIEEILTNLANVGIQITQFSPTSYQLDQYPNWIENRDVEKVVRELIELMIEQPDFTVPQYLEAGIIMNSCRGAIKANHYLDERQAQALIRDMADLQDPYHCPHGRPVFVEFNETTIEKLFKRIQDSHSTTLYD